MNYALTEVDYYRGSVPDPLWVTITGLPCGDLSAQYTPSIILYGKKWSILFPQRRGSSHSGEGKNSILWPFMMERRGYKKIPLVGFQDIHNIYVLRLQSPKKANLNDGKGRWVRIVSAINVLTIILLGKLHQVPR